MARSQKLNHTVLKKNGRQVALVSTIKRGTDLAIIDTIINFFEHWEDKSFETMVFEEGNGTTESECIRYDTVQEAMAGHMETVVRWARKLNAVPEYPKV